MDDCRLILDDCIGALPLLEPGSVDAVVTDPPYALTDTGRPYQMTSNGVSVQYDRATRTVKQRTRGGFMGKAWDGALPPVEVWQECLRVLKPGAYLLAFGGTRTFHRLACSLEDAGFQMRDTLCWLYGQGFPKSKACLKPAWEPILLCRKPGPKVLPLPGLDACRVPASNGLTPGGCKWKSTGEIYAQDKWTKDNPALMQRAEEHPAGRWPANVVLSHHAECNGECHPECPVRLLDEQSGVTSTTGQRSERSRNAVVKGTSWGSNNHRSTEYANEATGGAARFFYCAKASRRERNAGLEGMPEGKRNATRFDGDGGLQHRIGSDGTITPKATTPPESNIHPCVKPLAVMRWLCRLITPPGGVCLDPFLGSGTTGVAALQEGFDFIGIERDPEYFAIAEKRIAAARQEAPCP